MCYNIYEEKVMDKWDKRFMNLAEMVGTWTSCYKENRQVGAVCVKDKRVLCTGYNGAPAGVKTCKERGECMRIKQGIASGTRIEMCYAVHAEHNAIAQAAKLGISLQGATIYITHYPCAVCARTLINAGITRIVYKDSYPDDFSPKLLAEAGVKVEKYEE